MYSHNGQTGLSSSISYAALCLKPIWVQVREANRATFNGWLILFGSVTTSSHRSASASISSFIRLRKAASNQASWSCLVKEQVILE